jgi:dihydrofolate reductase
MHGAFFFAFANRSRTREAPTPANKLYITEVHQDFDGDTKFPDINKNIWRETAREDHLDQPIPYSFVEYIK